MAEIRAVADVFKSSVRPPEPSSRFATAGRFTAEQLEKGADLEAIQDAEQGDALDFDPEDKRSLYERLQEQKDAKQAEWEHKHTFKNQMDHWRLDGDDAGFEDDRLEKQRRQHAEATRLRDESAQFYKLARAAQERPLPAAVPAAVPAAAFGERKRKAGSAALPGVFKVLRPSDAPVAAAAAAAATTAGRAAQRTLPPARVLPGLEDYCDE